MAAKVFISYSRARSKHAKALSKKLESIGYDVFIDSKIVAGEDFEKRILQELQEAHAVVALWDNKTIDSGPVLDECRRANKLDKLLPVVIEPVSIHKLPFELSSKQYIEAFELADLEAGDAFNALMRGLTRLCDPERHIALMKEQDSSIELKPVKPEPTDSTSINLSSILDDLKNDLIQIPAYQREGNQWDLETKSLFVESIINNLPVPAFFFEPKKDSGINYVVDGQQRLEVLLSYFNDEFELIDSDNTPYISEQAEHYRGRKFSELHSVFQNSFRRYQLTVMKVRDLGEQRLEIFRRINRGGVPLSAQDIRLAYYSSSSVSMNFIRMVGIIHPETTSSKRLLQYMKDTYSLRYPWPKPQPLEKWTGFWSKGAASRGQNASQMFLWSLVAADIDRAEHFLPKTEVGAGEDNKPHVLDHVLDKYCEVLSARDEGKTSQDLMSTSEICGDFFAFFSAAVTEMFGKTHIVPDAAPKIALTIGAMYAHGLRAETVKKRLWNEIPKYIWQPNKLGRRSKINKISFTNKWANSGGYYFYIRSTQAVLEFLVPKSSL